MWGQLAIGLKSGDIYLYLICALSWLGLTIVIERIITLQFVYNLDFKKFLKNLKKMIQAEDTDRAMSLCKKARRSSLPAITLRALEASEVDPTTVRTTLEEETLEFLPRIEARMALIPAAATATLFIGVLGTMDFLWRAFSSVGVLDTADKQATLSASVSSALVPTTAGLVSCLILLVGHHIVRGLAIRFLDRFHHGITVVTNLVAPQQAFATYVASAPTGATGSADVVESFDSSEDYSQPSAATASTGEANDAFSDASVEDIKDEEEII